MKRIFYRSVFILFFATKISAAPDAKALLKKADDGRFPSSDISFEVSVEDLKSSKSLRNQVYSVRFQPPASSVIETIFPPKNQGRKLLMKDEDFWFYTPDIKRPTRVSLQQKLTGEVANGDIARTNFSYDYDARFEKETSVGKKKAYQLYLVANKKQVTYQKIRYWVEANPAGLPIRAEFLTEADKLIKVADFSEPKMVLGKNRVTKMTITDGLVKSRQSVLVFSKFKTAQHSDRIFNKDSLAE